MLAMNYFSRLLAFLFCCLLLTACETSSGRHSPLVRSGAQADYIVVQKSDKLLTLWSQGKILRTYNILAMGARPNGHKMQEGDERTPEGLYAIDEKHTSQNFQKFLRISYPNKEDKANAKRNGVSPGGQVGIHGDRGGAVRFFFSGLMKNGLMGA
jgi:murein L,D-transpeptidase YafK